MQKCSDGEEHFSEHFCQSWNEITNTQKIVGWYKVYIQGISEPNEKQKNESGKHQLEWFLCPGGSYALSFTVAGYLHHNLLGRKCLHRPIDTKTSPNDVLTPPPHIKEDVGVKISMLGGATHFACAPPSMLIPSWEYELI